MDNWEKYFADAILERGQDYYDMGLVKIREYSSNYIQASVEGTIDYKVGINFRDGEITAMYCDCPYFQDRDYCKHLAATLYYIENHPELLNHANDVSDLLSGFSKRELVDFLTAEIAKNPDLEMHLRLFKNSDIDETAYVNKLKRCFGDSFEVLKFMNNDIQDLINAGQFDLIFTLCRMIMQNIEEESKYGHVSSLEDIIYEIDDIMTQIRDSAPTEDITEFLMDSIKSTDDYFIDEILTDSLSRNGDMSKLLAELIPVEEDKMKGYDVKVRLDDFRPLTWRDIIIPAGMNFKELDTCLKILWDFGGYHLSRFTFKDWGDVVTNEFEDIDFNPGELNSKETIIDRYFENNSKIYWEYDYGDGWTFTIEVKKAVDYDKDYITVKRYKGEYNPQDDIGGVWGLERLIIQDSSRLNKFDLADVQHSLKNYKDSFFDF